MGSSSQSMLYLFGIIIGIYIVGMGLYLIYQRIFQKIQEKKHNFSKRRLSK